MLTSSSRSSPTSLAVLAAAFALFACWLAPGHYFPWVSYQNEVVAGVAGALFGLSAVVSRAGAPAWPRVSLFIAVVALVPAVQWAFGQISFRSDAVLSFLYLGTLSVSIAAGATLSRDDRRSLIDAVMGALLAAAIVSVGLALVQWLMLNPSPQIAWVPPGYRPIGNIAQPNHLASLFALGLLGGLWFYETHRVGGRVMLLVALWLAIGMALARSRMNWLAVTAVVVALAWVGTRVTMRLRVAPSLGWLALLAAATLAMGPLSAMLDTAPLQSVTERFQTGGGRLRIWTNLFDGLMQSPWLGYGWSQVSRAGLAGSTNHYVGEQMLRQSHSLPLDLVIWVGIPLGLLLIGALAWWWWHQVRRCDSAERAVVLSAVGIVSIHSLVEFPLESFYFLIPFGVLVGALEGWSTPLATVRTSLPRAAMAAAVGGMTALGAAVAIEYLTVEDASRNGRLLAAGFVASAPLPEPRLLDEPIEYVRFWRTRARAGMSTQELDWMRRVVGRNPSPPALLRYATALGLNGAPQAAARTLVQLCNMHLRRSCDEGRESWTQLQRNFPVLTPIPYPATPKP